MVKALFWAILLVAAAWPAVAGDIVAPREIFAGERPNISIVNLKPGQRIALHAVRVNDAAVQKDGQWSTEKRLTQAYGVFIAGAGGRVDPAAQAPIEGSWDGVDPRALFWSGYLAGDPKARVVPVQVPSLVTDVPDNVVRLILQEGGRITGSHSIRIRGRRPGVQIEDVNGDGWVGAFLRPSGDGPFPAVLLLHGSNGGVPSELRAAAAAYANNGFAALAISYFAWPYQNVKGVPTAFVNLPVETVFRAREWLSKQSTIDKTRQALVGISKGAELALLAASIDPSIDNVVACVPSDVVWSGFGGDVPLDGRISSWSVGGKPLPYIPYTDWRSNELKDATTGARHRQDLAAASPEVRKAAQIDFSRWTAKVLLISGGRDETWPSLPMGRDALQRIRAAQPDIRRSRILEFADAGHFICGTGLDPARLWGDDPFRNGGGTASANGKAASAAWDATLNFLKEM